MVTSFDIYGNTAIKLVDEGKSFFITGKAGTGKTTLLREIVGRALSKKKKVAVIAPTGVAAKNAEGITIHSFLHLKVGPYLPDGIPAVYRKFDASYIKFLKDLDLIIVDEVSMVRCDVMDAMDVTLRHYRDCDEPFGGVQIVLFGDLYQLMPVVRSADEETLLEHYIKDQYYFFNSDVIEDHPLPMLELQKIYRQEDKDFVDLLNRIRDGKMTNEDINVLDEITIPNYEDDEQIRITTHKYLARNYNDRRLSELDGNEKIYEAEIMDYFPKTEFPTERYLNLKEGARVMFIKNDNDDNTYANGTLGEVIYLDKDSVTVLTDDGDEIDVERVTWRHEEYRYNASTGKVDVITKGSFTQFPLRLAWAITIHKSQGLTFDNVIIDAGKSFAYGQVYVALSRCRSIEGITLASRIKSNKVKTDPLVVDFMESVERIEVKDDRERKTPTNRKKITGTLKATLKLLQEGYDIPEVAKKRGLALSTIHTHTADLIEYGYINVHDYVSDCSFQIINDVIDDIGDDAPFNEILKSCDDQVDFPEISKVRAYRRYEIANNQRVQKEHVLKWKFEDVEVCQSSRAVFDMECRFVTSSKGYYLKINEEFMNLGKFPANIDSESGFIYIDDSSNTDNGSLELIHQVNQERYVIGWLDMIDDEIKYIDPYRNSYSILLNE